MKEKIQLIIKIAVFLIVLLSVVIASGKVLIPKWYDEWNNTAIVDDFYKLPKNTLDVLTVGSSQVIKGFSALQLYRDYGMSAYGLGTEQQSIQGSYAWIKESLKTQQEKVVLYEVKMLFEDTPEPQYRKTIDNMKFSLNKLELIANASLVDQKSITNFISYIFPITRFHSRWFELTSTDFTKEGEKTPNYRGYSLKNGRSGEESYKVLDETIQTEQEITENRVKYFNKIVNLCEENNIKLVLFKLPDLDWDTERYNATCKLAEENKLEYIDFNTEKYYNEIDFNYANDTEVLNHLNILGTEKVTNYLGKYISENCEIEDKRGKEEYSHLDNELTIYNYDLQNKQLVNIFEPGKYIEALKSDNFTVVIVKNNINLDDSEACKDFIAKLGLDFEKVKADNYCAVFENGQKKIEEASSDVIEIESVLDNKKMVISTKGKGSILVEQKEFSIKNPGFDLMIYNNKNHEFVESSYIGYENGIITVGR